MYHSKNEEKPKPAQPAALAQLNYCAQCAVAEFDEDFHDYAGLTTAEETANKITLEVLCAGCGVTLVNHLGACVSNFCPTHGKRAKSSCGFLPLEVHN